MSFSSPFILRPVATSLLMTGILLVGFVAFRRLPVLPGRQPRRDVLIRYRAPRAQGASVITLQFVLDLNIDLAEQQVQATNPADAPILTLGLTSTSLSLAKVEDLADTRPAQKISRPGVGLVSISGGQKPAGRVQANPTSLSAYGLSLEDVRQAIGASSVNQAEGSFDGSHQSYTIGALVVA